jgi:hypothetical protein
MRNGHEILMPLLWLLIRVMHKHGNQLDSTGIRRHTNAERRTTSLTLLPVEDSLHDCESTPTLAIFEALWQPYFPVRVLDRSRYCAT